MGRRQRPPSAAAEDRNTSALSAGAARDDGSGRRPRRPRIATFVWIAISVIRLPAAAAVRGGRGSQPFTTEDGAEPVDGSGRRPRRPRIATGTPPHHHRPPFAAAAVRGGRGSQRWGHRGCGVGRDAAAAVRGGRGSQPHRPTSRQPGGTSSGSRPRRPRIATWTASPSCGSPASRSGRRPRRPRNATQHSCCLRAVCQSRSGRRPRRPRIATTARGRSRRWCCSSGRRGSQQLGRCRCWSSGDGSGRRPRRPRIATPCCPTGRGQSPGSGRRLRRPRITTAVHVFLAGGCCGQAPSSVSHHWPGAAFPCPARHRRGHHHRRDDAAAGRWVF